MNKERFTLLKYDLQLAFDHAKQRGEELYKDNFTIALDYVTVGTNMISRSVNYTFVFTITHP